MKKIIYTLVIITFFYSCGNNLSRNEAEKLINQNSKFQETGNSPKLNENAIANGINQGFWSKNRNLTPEGYNNFNAINFGSISLKVPLKCIVTSIDGIADSKNLYGNGNDSYKEAQFSWEFSDVNSVTKRFILKGGTGVAFFRKFDDGWRIDNISVDYSNSSFELNESDRMAMEKDIEKENQRRIEEQIRIEEEIARRKAEEEERKQLVAKALVVNNTIGNYNAVDDFTGKGLQKKITLTDVHFFRDLSGTQYLNIWFGSINSKPTFHRFRQTAMGWTGFAVQVNDKSIVFKDENEAAKFYKDLIDAIENWNKIFPDLKKW